MIYEHEIPNNSKLYFGKSARLKREIETKISSLFYKKGYEEIVTPIFSYHQHQNMDNKTLIKFYDSSNHTISLRADSTLDVVRLITNRLGRSVKQKKWFYIQPVFRYPSLEQYQIGAEHLENGDLSVTIDDAVSIIKTINIKPSLQISNMQIPIILSKELKLSIKLFENMNLESVLALKIDWLSKLASLSSVEDIKEIIGLVPSYLKDELERVYTLSKGIDYENIVVAPLFYSKMRYYDNLFFRYFIDNRVIAMGGSYMDRGIKSTGFALYTDNIIEELLSEN
jgi:histidyl-tRNA synthetase